MGALAGVKDYRCISVSLLSSANAWRGEADHSGGVVRQLFTQKPDPSSRIDLWRGLPAWNKLRPSSRTPGAPPHAVSLSQSPAPSALHLSRTNGSKRGRERSSTWRAPWADWTSGCASVYKSSQKRRPWDPQADCSAGLHAKRTSHATEFPRTHAQSTSRFHQQTSSICTSKKE